MISAVACNPIGWVLAIVLTIRYAKGSIKLCELIP